MNFGRRTFLKLSIFGAASSAVPLPEIEFKPTPTNLTSFEQCILEMGKIRKIANQSLRIDNLGDGFIPLYDNGQRSTVTYIEENRVIEPNQMTLSNVSSLCNSNKDMNGTPTLLVPIHDIAVRASSLKEGERKVNAIKDVMFFKTLKHISDQNIASSQIISNVDPDVHPICNSFSNMERWDLTVNKIILHPKTAIRIRRTLGVTVWTDIKDKELNKKGIIGYLFGAYVYVSNLSPKNYVFFLPDEEYLGAIPTKGSFLFPNEDTYVDMTSMAILNNNYISSIRLEA